MRKLSLALAAATMVAAPIAIPAPAMAQGYYQGKTWRGADGRTYCRKRNGTTGLLVGGAAGSLDVMWTVTADPASAGKRSFGWPFTQRRWRTINDGTGG